MKDLKKYMGLLLALVMCLSLAACDGNFGSVESGTISSQNNRSDTPVSNEDTVNEVSMYEGLWLCEVTDQYDYLQFDVDGNWQLYQGGNVIDEGYLQYDPEDNTTYICSNLDGAIGGGSVELEDDDRLYITTAGDFNYLDGRGGQWQGDIGGNWDDENRGAIDLYHQDVSVFRGTWYLDNDLSAETYIIIDGNGNWSCYRRTSGDPEAAITDRGTFSYSTNEPSIYYADSAMYDGVRHRVFEFDEGILIWGDEGTYYRLEE